MPFIKKHKKMKKIVLSTAVVFALSLASCNNTTQPQEGQAEVSAEQLTETGVSGTFNIEPTSVVEWKGSKPTGGSFTLENGKVSGEFVLDMNSITVTDLAEDQGKLDLEAHLKGTGEADKADHFFNVGQYPTGTFKLTAFDGTNVTGDLTLKGKTKTISFPATLTVTDSSVTLESKPFEINRVDYGVNYNSGSVFGDLKDRLINDEVELVVKVSAKK